MTTHHLDALQSWVAQQPGLDASELELIAGDASPRQYYRVGCLTDGLLGVSSRIVMVSPPSENNEAFLHVGRCLASAGVQTPKVLAQLAERGWFLLEDFGDVQLLSVLNTESASFHYRQAFDVLMKQVQLPTAAAGIPDYNASRLHAELSLFSEWFLPRLLNVTVSEPIMARFTALSEQLLIRLSSNRRSGSIEIFTAGISWCERQIWASSIFKMRSWGRLPTIRCHY